MKLEFKAPQMLADGTFSRATFVYDGDEEGGWILYRDGVEFMRLGAGFRALQVLHCGVCSTDIARPYLPYPLPQIVGHEVAVLDSDGNLASVEINASHLARGLDESCPYCDNGIDTQCPHRITMGIDRLPGGFAPYLLAPVHAITRMPEGVSPAATTLVEPLAAAIHAVESDPPREGSNVAVIGPRRLGMLILAALKIYRKKHSMNFNIVAILRSKRLSTIALEAGADQVLTGEEKDNSDPSGIFQLIYDTTGTLDGFDSALRWTESRIHLKSTTGRETGGMHHLSDLVVDELAILPFSPEALAYGWENERRKNRNVYVHPEIPEEKLQSIKSEYPELQFHRMDPLAALEFCPNLTNARLPRFDLAMVLSPAGADSVVRPRIGSEESLIRPRGAILVLMDKAHKDSSNLWKALLERNLQLRSSRCGSFARVVDYFKEDPTLAARLERLLITDHYPLDEIELAFDHARKGSQSIKVVVDCKRDEEKAHTK